VSETASLRLAIIGCGNPARSDDGAGIEVIRLLAQSPMPPGVALIDAGTSGMDVMFRVRGARRVVIVDACRSGSEPGAIFRLPAREVMTPAEHGYSLHGLRWDHAIYAGCRIFGDDFADHAEVVLIESRELGFGLELSDPVRRAACSVAAMLAPLIAGDG
jgi:hydrogenase maturation protease